MKKIAALFALIIVSYSIYFDLTTGTLPVNHSAPTMASQQIQTEERIQEEPYTNIEIVPGDTVLSVYEKILDGPLPVAIDDLVADFIELNDGIKPEQIQVGKSYKFPLYDKSRVNTAN